MGSGRERGAGDRLQSKKQGAESRLNSDILASVWKGGAGGGCKRVGGGLAEGVGVGVTVMS